MLDPMDDELRKQLALGREAFDKRELIDAERILGKVLEQHDALADVHNMMGLIAHNRGDFNKAQRHFERALALNAAYTDAALNLAVTYTDIGKYDQAQATLQRLGLRTKPASGAPAPGPDKIEQFARGKLANMHAEVAQAYADLGLIDDAIHELERAITLAPSFADLRHRLAQHLQSKGRLDEAKQQLNAALEHSPHYLPAKLRLGSVLVAQGDVEGARAAWNEVLALDPDHPIAKMYLRAHTTP